MNNKFIIALVFHIIFLIGVLNAFFLVAFSSVSELLSGYKFDVLEIVLAILLIIISELLVSFKLKKMKIERKNYTDKSYLIRRLIRSFFVTGTIYYFMFNPKETLIIAVPLIIYFLLITPNKLEFKKYTS